jgi:hypothetical protein
MLSTSYDIFFYSGSPRNRLILCVICIATAHCSQHTVVLSAHMPACILNRVFISHLFNPHNENDSAKSVK